MLWLWCRLAATALIGPLARELPYVAGAALKNKTTTTTTKCIWDSHIGQGKRALRVSHQVSFTLIPVEEFFVEKISLGVPFDQTFAARSNEEGTGVVGGT